MILFWDVAPSAFAGGCISTKLYDKISQKIKLHNEELHDLYSLPNIIRIIKARRMRWEGHVIRMGEKRNTYRLLVGKLEGRSPLARPRRRWVDNIRIDHVEVGWGDMDWIRLAQDRDKWRALVNLVLNLRVPYVGALSPQLMFVCRWYAPLLARSVNTQLALCRA
jgi:hypothetical protein